MKAVLGVGIGLLFWPRNNILTKYGLGITSRPSWRVQGRSNQRHFPLQGRGPLARGDHTFLRLYITLPVRQQVPSLSSPPGTDLSPFFGLAKVTILLPRELSHPVLPFTHTGKLTFPLCRACAISNVDLPLLDKVSTCRQMDHERCLVGTWCSPELEKAVEMGYQILKIYEVWHFTETKVGLFRDYLNT